MSAEISAEFVDEEPVDPMMVKIRAEVELSSAVRDYVEAEEKFKSASKDFTESWQTISEIIKPKTRIVVRLSYGKHCLLTSDDEGNFTVYPVDVI